MKLINFQMKFCDIQSQEPPEALKARHSELTRKVAERQQQVKVVIDKLRTMQHEISILTTCTVPLEAYQAKT